MDKKNILITGGAGFVGSYISKQLLNEGHQSIVYDAFISFLDPFKSNYQLYQKKRLEMLDGNVHIIKGDIRDYDMLLKTIKEYRPEVVLHLAAIPLANVSNELSGEALDINMNGLMTVIRAIGAVNFVKRIVYVSSSFVYGHFQYTPVDENHPTNPIDVYGGTKLAGESLIKGFATRFGIDYVIIRPSAIYGPADSNLRVTQTFLENAVAGIELQLRGAGQKLDFTYVKDAVQGFILALTRDEAKNEVFNITFGEGRSLKEFADILINYFPDLKIMEYEFEKFRPKRGSLDISKSKNLLGFYPEYPLEIGIKEYVEWIRSL
jgi:nucleoside-diphosphate-sugar epimerase